MIEQVSLLDLGQAAQTVEQQPIDCLRGGAEGVGKGQVGYPSVAAVGRTALAIKARKLQRQLIT